MKTNKETFLELIELFKKMDVEGPLQYYADDIIYKYGSYPAVVGKAAVAEAAKSSHMDFIEKMEFNILQTWADGNTVIAQMELPHWLKDGRQVVIPCVDIVKFDEAGKIKEFLVYLDASPLFQSH